MSVTAFQSNYKEKLPRVRWEPLLVAHVFRWCRWAARFTDPTRTAFPQHRASPIVMCMLELRVPGQISGHSAAIQSKRGNLSEVSPRESGIFQGGQPLGMRPVRAHVGSCSPFLKGVLAACSLTGLMTLNATPVSLPESDCGKPRLRRWKSAWVSAS